MVKRLFPEPLFLLIYQYHSYSLYMKSFHTLYTDLKPHLRADILSGITVALALIPEAIAFAFVAGVPPLLSIQTAIMMCLVAAIFTGRPGMISSSTAAISVVFAPLIAEHGLQYLFATVILMGLIQIFLHLINLGKFASIIPHSVVLGFLNGLAIVIFIAQWAQFQIREIIVENGQEITQMSWLPAQDFAIMFGFVILTMIIIHLFPRINKTIPSPLVAILTITGISSLLAWLDIYSLITVADFAGEQLKAAAPSFIIPSVPLNFETLSIIFPYALIGGLVGLTEATLTTQVIDDMTSTKGFINKEFFAQGIANVINGFFGGMGGDAMVGQSIINVQSGGRTRISSITAGLGLIILMVFAAPLVNAIPLASLVGLMFMVVISTFQWEIFKYKGRIPGQDILIIATVTILTIFTDLATAVIAGILLATIIFAWEKGKALEVKIQMNSKGHKIYKVNGVIFFGSMQKMKGEFDVANDPEIVILDLKYAKVMGISAIESINKIAQKYEAAGKELIVTRPNENCKLLLKNAADLTSIHLNEEMDPTEI